ncbi:hypothetical protein KCV00_g233, partial [Aureobasidium melanogenum]
LLASMAKSDSAIESRWAYRSLAGKKEKTRRGNHEFACASCSQTVLFTPHQNTNSTLQIADSLGIISRPSHEKSRLHQGDTPSKIQKE